MGGVLVAAAWGAGGGILGAALAWAFAKALKRRPGWLSALPVVCIAVAVVIGRGQQPRMEEQVLAQLNDLPSVRAIKTYYPDDYNRLAAQVRALSVQSSPAEAQSAVGDVLAMVVTRQRPKANAESALGLYKVTRAEGDALRRISPSECAAFMDGRPAPSLARAMTPEIEAQDFAAAARLLEQTAKRPEPPAMAMADHELLALGSEALAMLTDVEQDVVIRVLKSEADPATREEARIMCDFNLALADVIIARPDAGTLVRRLWAAQ